MTTATDPNATRNIVEFLQDVTSYPDQPSRVETIETHISWVFLTDRFVYKLKKPVQFEFLDFSTPESRKSACEEEVRLNRRLSHDVYLAVVPITSSGEQGLEFDGRGREIDYVVKMRRLPAQRALDRLIRSRRLQPTDIDAASKHLVGFYTSVPSKVVQPEVHHRHLVDHCRANRIDLLAHLGPTDEAQIRRVHGAQQRFLVLQQDLFYERIRDGRIIDGHGDLRAEHIYLESPPAIIDCVEFSAEFREIDVIDELSFLDIDCRRLGNSDVGSRVIGDYQQTSGDHPPESLAAFYRSYRACVRAKVAALRAEQADEGERRPFFREAHQYLRWADHFAAQLGPPVLVIVAGLMGSGKSTLATDIARTIGAEVLRTDEIRREILGKSNVPAEYGKGIYDDQSRGRVYDELFSRAESQLDDGCSVVLDGTFLTNSLRRKGMALGTRHGATCLIVYCECPEETSLARIRQRAESENSASEARPDLYKQQLHEYEPLDPALAVLVVDATQSVDEELASVLSALRAITAGE